MRIPFIGYMRWPYMSEEIGWGAAGVMSGGLLAIKARLATARRSKRDYFLLKGLLFSQTNPPFLRVPRSTHLWRVTSVLQ